MRAARLLAPGHFEVEEHPRPEPGERELLIHVTGCGVCASNLGPWQGMPGMAYPLKPGAPGHEVYGRVAALGPGAEGFEIGDPVAALSYHGFAEYDVAPAADVVAVPPSLAEQPLPGEPLACAVNVARRAAVSEGDHVVVIGIGFLGALLLRLVRRASPARVVAVSRRVDALDMAKRFGADEALSLGDDVRARIAALTGGRMADVVIEATGKSAPLDLAAELVRVRGRLVIAGYHQDGPRTVNLQLWNWRGLDVINAHERDVAVYRGGMREGIDLLANGALDLQPLLTHTFPLARIADAFRSAAERPAGFFKALVAGAP